MARGRKLWPPGHGVTISKAGVNASGPEASSICGSVRVATKPRVASSKFLGVGERELVGDVSVGVAGESGCGGGRGALWAPAVAEPG